LGVIQGSLPQAGHLLKIKRGGLIKLREFTDGKERLKERFEKNLEFQKSVHLHLRDLQKKMMRTL